jgi:hypothetical protein
MKRTLFTILSLVCILLVNAQDFTAYPIVLKKGISIPNLNGGAKCRMENFAQLVANNPIGYYDLEDKYSTPLKLKHFKASSEYTDSILPQFNALRDSIMNATYFYTYNLRGVEYNLQTQKFTIGFRCHRSDNTSLKGYLGIGNYINLSCPSLKEEQGALSIGSYTQYLTTPKVSEELAVEIEDGKYQLLFLFKFDKIKTEKRDVYGGTSGVLAFTENFILCKTTKLYLYDPETNEVISDWSSLLTVSATKPKSKSNSSKRR